MEGREGDIVVNVGKPVKMRKSQKETAGEGDGKGEKRVSPPHPAICSTHCRQINLLKPRLLMMLLRSSKPSTAPAF